MPMTSSFPVYDPFARETPLAEHLLDTREFTRRCQLLIKSVYERNRAAGRKGKAAFHCIGIHREKKDFHNYFNLAMSLPKYEIFTRDVGAVEYGGAMGHAEALLSGEWRIASLEEEAECMRRDEKLRDAKIAQREKAAGSQVAAMMAGLASRVMGPVAPSLAGAKGK